MSEGPYEGWPPGGLATPTRNRYFPGKLLDEFHLTMEQTYGNRKEWLLNQLALGSGVVCGLDIAANKGLVQCGPGMAIDRHGRMVVVPGASPQVDPRQPTDDCGRPVGEPVPAGTTVTLYLAYHECETEYVPAMSCGCDCDNEPSCEASTIRERYRMLVIPETIERPDPQCTMPDLWDPDLDYPSLAKRISRPAQDVTGDGRIPLATITIDSVENDTNTLVIDPSVRPVVYTNEALLEAMVCLAERTGGGQPPHLELPKVTGIAPWQHGAELTIAQFVSQGLRITFDRPLREPAGPVNGWLLVTLEYDRSQFEGDVIEILVRRINPEEAGLATDKRSAFFRPFQFFEEWADRTNLPTRVLCRVVLKSHVLLDENSRALDGDFIGARTPSTGNGTQGGDFESWFTLTTREVGR